MPKETMEKFRQAKVKPDIKVQKGSGSQLTPDQIKYGSMYLAASNLGMDMRGVKSVRDIVNQWNQTAGDIEQETGQSAEPERKDWERDLRKGDSYAVEVVRKELPFLFEVKKLKEEKTEDGQPQDNFYVPSAMKDRDVIANILAKFSKAGVTYSFQGNDLIITAGTYTTDLQEKALDDLKITINEVIKFLKEQYKGIVGKALKISGIENETYDCVANYTVNRMSLCRLTCTYNLPDAKADSDASSEKAEIRGNIPVFSPKAK